MFRQTMLNLSLTKKLELSLEKIRNYCQAQPSPSLAGLSRRGYQGGMFGCYIIPPPFDRATSHQFVRGDWVSAQMNWHGSPQDKV